MPGTRRSFPRRLIAPILVPLALLLIGTVGYRLIEGPKWSLLDAAYMTAITLTTVGFLEVHELSPAGRLFTMFLCLGGIFTLAYVAGEAVRIVISGEIRQILGRNRMERELAEIHDHFVVCGFGRMGRFVVREFESQRLPMVIVDRDEKAIANGECPGRLLVVGDATTDEVLKKVGVERARALVAVAGSDADNLYIVLSARLLNPKMLIVARAEDPGAEAKLKRVGADRVVSPYAAGGFRMAHAVTRPNVVDFIELVTRTDHTQIQLEELKLAPGGSLVGQTLAEAQLQQRLRITLVAIMKRTGEMVSAPSGATPLDAGDTLIAVGERSQLDALEKLTLGTE